MTGAVLGRGLFFALLWWILVEGRRDAWGLGVVAVAVALGASLLLLPPRPVRISPVGLAAFLGFFLWHSVRGGAQVAGMALRPRLDLNPSLTEIPLALPPGPPRVLLVAALGLMPGTVGVELRGDRLRFHVLDARFDGEGTVRALEARIHRIFGATP